MNTSILSSQALEQDPVQALKASETGPVLITDASGTPTHVLLRFEDYQRLTKQHRSIVDALAMDGAEDIDFDPPRITIGLRAGG